MTRERAIAAFRLVAGFEGDIPTADAPLPVQLAFVGRVAEAAGLGGLGFPMFFGDIVWRLVGNDYARAAMESVIAQRPTATREPRR